MKTIKNLLDDVVLLINDDDIINGYLHDTYSEYGQQLSSYDAGDWCFEDAEFMREAQAEAEKKLGNIDWDLFEIETIGDTEIEISSDEEDSDMAEKIQAIMNSWAEKNYAATEATYINYWDGHNYKSIVLSFGDCVSEEWELLSDEEAKEYVDLFDEAEFGDWERGIKTAIVGGYKIEKSQWEGHFEIASIESE